LNFKDSSLFISAFKDLLCVFIGLNTTKNKLSNKKKK